jgi:hypothetical protein
MGSNYSNVAEEEIAKQFPAERRELINLTFTTVGLDDWIPFTAKPAGQF